MHSSHCNSCGSDGDPALAVHRVYLTLADGDTPSSETVMPDVEYWCYACMASYPHQLVDDTDSA